MDHPSSQPRSSPSTGLALAPSENRGLQLTSLRDIKDFAQIVVESGLAPRSFATANQVIIALVSGAELGISPMQSLQGLAVVQGKIGIGGDLALALCQGSPVFEDLIEEWIGEPGTDGRGCRITAKRRGRSPVTAEFTVGDAKRAQLWGKMSQRGEPTPWVTYPQRMLRYRALGFALRDAFPDILKGIKTQEELEDYPEEPKRGIAHAKPAKVEQSDSEKKPLVVSQIISGVIERAWPSDFQGKRYYHAILNGGQQLQTIEQELGQELVSAEGQEIRAAVVAGAKPNQFHLKYFEYVDSEDSDQPTQSKDDDAVLIEESPGVFTTKAPPKKESKLPERERLFATGLLTLLPNKKNDSGLEFWGATIGKLTLYTPHAHMGKNLEMYNKQQVKIAYYASLIPNAPNRVEVVGIELNSPAAARSKAKARHEGPDDVQAEWSDAEAAHLRKLIEEDDLSEVWILKAVQKLGWPKTDANNLRSLDPGLLRAIVKKWPEVTQAAHILEQGEELPDPSPVEEPKQDREEPANV